MLPPSELLKRVIAPYPKPPATANIARFCTIVDAEEEPLLLLDRNLLDIKLHLLLMLDDDLGHTLDDIIAIDLVVVESMAAIVILELRRMER